MKRGSSAVRSHPAETELADIFVPICAITKEAEMNHTPNLVAGEGLSSKNRPNKSMGDQIASPYIACEDELTRMPIKHTIEDAKGSAKSCGQSAAAGVLALDAKSGAFVISVTKLLMHDMRLTTIAQARLDPWMEEGCCTIGPIPCALKIHHMRNTIAAVGVTTVFTTKKWRILCTGNHNNGSDRSQNKKKHIKSRVFVPDEAGSELGMVFTLGHIARNITRMHVPPMLACTPYHIQAIAPRLKTHHKLPKTPKLVRATTGNVIWNTAPGRAFKTRNGATATNPAHAQIQACHHDRPSWIMEDTIIQVLMLNMSATQNAT